MMNDTFENMDSWIIGLLKDFGDSRVTFGITDDAKKFVIRVENIIVGTGENIRDAVLDARKTLAQRKVEMLASVESSTATDIGSALRVAANYLGPLELALLSAKVGPLILEKAEKHGDDFLATETPK